METEKATKSVVIVGCGISGLSAAKHLLKNGGYDVIVLEASSRIGGRIYSTKFGDSDSNVEVGAQWVHGENGNSIFDLATANELLNLEKDNKKYGMNSFFVTHNGEFLDHGMFDKMEKLMAYMQQPTDDNETFEENANTLSKGQVSTAAFWKFNEDVTKLHEDDEICSGILDWIHRYENNIDAADNWNDTSYIGQAQYKTCEGNPTIAWKSQASYFSLLNCILNDHPSEVEEDAIYSTDKLPPWIQLQKEVIKIQYGGDGPATLICRDGSDYTCDYVICTVSLGVLKENHSTLFRPRLPDEKVLAIEHIGFGTVDKIFLEFENQWWPADCDGFNLLWDTNSINWTTNASDEILGQVDDKTGLPVWTRSLLGFHTVPSQSKMLMCWITGDPARYMEKLDTEEIKPVLTNVLRTFIGNSFKISEPIQILRSKWYTNPFTRGSYSFRQISSESNNVWAHQLAAPIILHDKPILCFAGESTHDHFYSTVHGSFDTGIREADRIIKHNEKPWFSFCPFTA